ncbi:peptidase T [Aerococcaceae bacterium DSM 111176]|nr:peptidase T [Aerococcaceae bacterium DSM 111176]
MFNQELENRFIRYAKINTRSDENSPTTPSTERQFDLLNLLVEELTEIGLAEVQLDSENAFVTATLPANTDKDVPSIGLIAHVDTADFNSENVQPQIVEEYDGGIVILNEALDIKMTPEEFPNLAKYQGQRLITTDGTTLLGADDKSGIAEIVVAMKYLVDHPEIEHGKVRVAFGPDEEIGRGADFFKADEFGVDFAYTLDGGPVGELEYESFNAAAAKLTVKGMNVHPGTAKDKMINSTGVLRRFMNLLPESEVPEKTEGREGFYHVTSMEATEEQGKLDMIIRDHDRDKFEARKQFVLDAIESVNNQYSYPVIEVDLFDQYYNMGEIIEKDMRSVDLAHKAMQELEITPLVYPIRGGTDGSKISFMGIPTPNIFAGGENMHGRYEFVAVESMVKATETIIKIITLNVVDNAQ